MYSVWYNSAKRIALRVRHTLSVHYNPNRAAISLGNVVNTTVIFVKGHVLICEVRLHTHIYEVACVCVEWLVSP